MKRILGLDGFSCGLEWHQEEVLLTAPAQNLSRLAKLICRSCAPSKTETAHTPYQTTAETQKPSPRPKSETSFATHLLRRTDDTYIPICTVTIDDDLQSLIRAAA
ncbi:hypothetical protein [Bradyrhizobium vignae]|uniref:Uncharacterized protein n=1 Tax=Bradyrhizobium vignae TaxID=1549949 RepID=A0ABS4A285_9BRAD|nr:hypothetical protein [Bradyrhizobium vignae]MBP0114406.1 hypothetical protein [Bradyrhizobium vignae]